ncbi:MAG: hypothetical protein ABI333_15760 [bacterium]
MSAFAFRSYLRADHYLAGVLRTMERRGKTLSAEGCVDAVIYWRKECRGARVLCDNFSSRVMATCLKARDRRVYCRTLPRYTASTRFGYRDCRKRSVTRQTKRACAAAFRMIDFHCRQLRRAKAPPTASGGHP